MRKISVLIIFCIFQLASISAKNLYNTYLSYKKFYPHNKYSSLSDDRKSGINYLNKLRSYVNLNSLNENYKLDKMAQNHANYLILNNEFSHYEDFNKDGFTGYSPLERAQYVGYSSFNIVENISAGNANIIESIDYLFSAIYHRLGFLDFNINEIGIGEKFYENYTFGNVYVFDMGNSYSDRDILLNLNPLYIIWPFENATNILPAFENEIPNPLPGCVIGGYPVSIQFNPNKVNSNFSFLDFKLYDRNLNIIDTKLLTEETDPNGELNDFEYVLVPLNRLNWGEKYTAKFSYMEDGNHKEIQWSFYTKKLDHPYFIINNSNTTIHIKPNKYYILYFPPQTCNDVIDSINYYYDNSPPILNYIDYNTLLLYTQNNDSSIIIQTSNNKKVNVQIGNYDNAIYPSSSEENIPPVITFFTADPTVGFAPLQVTFMCSAYDTDGYIVSYKWDLDGDGKIDVVTNKNSYTYIYDSPGIYNVKIIVVDNKGKETSKNILIQINSVIKNVAPEAPLNPINLIPGSQLIDVSKNIVNVEPLSQVYLQPYLYVNSEDIGKYGTLLMYIYFDQLTLGFLLPEKNVFLRNPQKFDIISNVLDFSQGAGIEFEVYYGYMIENRIEYNGYKVKIGK